MRVLALVDSNASGEENHRVASRISIHHVTNEVCRTRGDSRGEILFDRLISTGKSRQSGVQICEVSQYLRNRNQYTIYSDEKYNSDLMRYYT
jgi:hypothetical protein